jgi:deferrochelatase/peroxidase EfeB
MCPKLDPDEIQGDVIPGFRRGYDEQFHQVFVLLRISDVSAARRALRTLLPARITWSQELAGRKPEQRRRRHRQADVNVAFTRGGLATLKSDLDAHLGAHRAFFEGLAARSEEKQLLGSPEGWVVGGPEPQVDVVLNVGSTNPVDFEVDDLLRSLAPGFIEIRRSDGQRFAGEVLPGGIEHFGFRDGLAPMHVRLDPPAADASSSGTDTSARREVAPYLPAPEALATYVDDPDPAQARHVAVGEGAGTGQQDQRPPRTVFASAPDVPPGRFVVEDDGFWANGSFMVWIRLRQHVGAFWQECARMARKLSAEWRRPVSPDDAAALLVGRRRDGTALALCGLGDVNEFSYRQASRFGADRYGLRCPLGAHSRKMNPRSVDGLDHVILRRGIPYGTPVRDGADDGVDRGLFFVAYQASIEDQYEVLQGRWANRASEPEAHGSPDAMVSAASWGGMSIEIPNPNGRGSVGIGIRNRWVEPTGGLYLFVPSRKALDELGAGDEATGA